MKTSRDDWEQRLRSATEVPFPEELKERTLKAALEIERTGGQRHKRRGFVRGWLAGVGGVAAAAVLILTVWNIKSSPPSTMKSPITAGNTTASTVAEQVRPGQPVTFASAPVRITDVHVEASHPGGPLDTISAKITNEGTTPITKADLFGVLSFTQKPETGLKALVGTDWVTIVNGTDAEIAPKQSRTWTFTPVTAPHDAAGNLTEVPNLFFYRSGIVKTAPAGTTWNQAKVTTAITGFHLIQKFKSGQSFQLQLNVENTGSTPVDWSKVVAVVWFTPSGNSGEGDFTKQGLSRFMTVVKPPAGAPTVLQPERSENLVFSLSGGVDPNLSSDTAHVIFVNGTTAAGALK